MLHVISFRFQFAYQIHFYFNGIKQEKPVVSSEEKFKNKAGSESGNFLSPHSIVLSISLLCSLFNEPINFLFQLTCLI